MTANSILFLCLQYITLSTNVPRATCAWWRLSLAKSCPSTREHPSLGTAPGGRREPRERAEQSKLGIYLRKSFLTICSPKMELADLGGEVLQQSWVTICQGQAAGPAPRTQHPAQGGAGGAGLLCSESWQYRSSPNWSQLMKKRNTGKKMG